MYSALIPFSGFYNSYHSDELDIALQREFDMDGSSCQRAISLAERFSDSIDWSAVQTKYAERYAQEFAKAIGAKEFVFEEMQSPREYNFTTDRIFGRFPEGFMRSLFADVDIRAELDIVARKWFTSCSGFYSHYSPNVKDWGDMGEWDHNQFGALLQAATNIKLGKDFDDFDLCEDFDGNGLISNWLWANTRDNHATGDRCYRVAEYLTARKER